MAELPTGTLTFLFTDVEGSTRLWERHPQAMRRIMARHDALLTQCFEQHKGVVVRPRGEGDSLFAVFMRASDAVTAALEGQRVLLTEDWGAIGPLRVRMGLHTGEADLRAGDYYGSAVNRCARIRAAGHGGQVLLSEATAKLVRETLPDGATLLDLGRHRLRDLSEPEQLFQLIAADLPGTFPPLKTLESRPNNLPLQLTSFVGRGRELAELASLLKTARLVTLTGPGGTGKTRLALHVAAGLLDGFSDGVFFVDLASLQDPALVPAAVAQALGVQGLPEVSARESVLRFLRDKQVLLVLDNYEHLLAAAEFAAALLQAAPAVRLLVTSRAPLRVTGEREYAVAPLLAPQERVHSAAELAQNPAVQLFVQRAQAVRADFALSDANASTVAATCARLDGLPLALELAAARMRALPVAALLARLEQRLPILTGGARDVPARQQTLRDAIAWSYALLEPAEQRLFRRVGVFAGGCTLALAEAVCTADGDLGLDVLDGVGSLVEKSLLREVDGQAGEPRYRMLETIREFALGELEAHGEAEAVRRHLAVQVLQLVRQAAVAGAQERLDVDLDNARTVLGWCVEHMELAVGVRLFWALRWYLHYRGLGKELNLWRQRLLALPDASAPSVSRARLLGITLFDPLSLAEQERAVLELEEAIGLSRALGDASCLADALQHLAVLRMSQGRFDALVPPAEEALPLYLAAGAPQAAASMQLFLVHAALSRGDIATAEALVAANRALEGTKRSSPGLSAESALAEAHGDHGRARVFLEESARAAAALQGEQSPDRLARLAMLVQVTLRQGDTRGAVARCTESLAVERRVGPSRFLAAVLTVLAQAAERCGRLPASARLLAAVDGQRRTFAVEVPGVQEAQQAAVARVRVALGEAAFAEAWAVGEALAPEEAIELGLAVAGELAAGPAALILTPVPSPSPNPGEKERGDPA